MMNKTLIALALFGTCGYANAANVDNTWYVGAGAGQSNYESVDATSHLGDDSDLAWNALVGYQLNKYLAIEAGWQDLGTNDDTHLWGGLDGSQEIDVDGFTLGVVGTLPLSDKWFLTGEAGAYQYHLSHQMSANQYVSATDTAPYFGAGVGYNITNSLAISAKYRRFADIDETAWNTVNMDAQTVGLQLTYRFGVKAATATAVVLPAVIDKQTKPMPRPKPEPKYEIQTNRSSVVVLFGFDSTTLSNASKTKLDQVIHLSKQQDQDVILLNGQSDNQGDSQYNLKLSEKRVQHVEAYLTSHGVEVNRIDKDAIGEQDAHANTVKDRALERRVIVTLTSQQKVLAS
ncbi:cell envelope biogenesis protein OmpA [Shewanella sp. Choline-02u-19]|uniref:outer membrane beta-barrel protein n=1 Tax=unclassified Shewanella TaxID=196818 RepID=UPI000C342547|nr:MULTISPECIES: outer membrane beta-barrel protein [unclassified Shewanella]PKH62863.1 cell envelope biogenesis protein OmpA [Shewanella sp. Bg11-22]PKI27014.1 cell envelope biogenesis protein OmpA [Shewanella sp. Choline-02u-19]